MKQVKSLVYYLSLGEIKMSKYAMSDLHGEYNRFLQMFELIDVK